MLYTQAYRFVEFFSGEGNLTWCLKHCGFRGLQLDKDFGGRFNNIFEPAGFAWLCLQCMMCALKFKTWWLMKRYLRYLFQNPFSVKVNDNVLCIYVRSVSSAGVRCLLFFVYIPSQWLCLHRCAALSPICAAARHAGISTCRKGMIPGPLSSVAMSCLVGSHCCVGFVWRWI